MKYIFLIFTLFYILFKSSSSFDIEDTFMTNKEFYKLIDELGENNYANSQIKMMFLKIKKKKKSKKFDYEKMRRILKEFFLTIGVNVKEIVNWNNMHYVAIIKIDERIDRNLILEQFSDVIEDISEKHPQLIKNEL